ncbi:hypothetical protein SISSUDRAFT_1056364 [Sistotremastrum suecicum HHB10207 ss-3]|uniref:Uncharacterized protein n=1 Tax=Sistotremastrum suecicum HHB10207 ss-3 TaxID=1314776 RepID=A0A165WZB7_9AGAM|nr:hypothetical protein SISSUDRAFT_1056364 [Sistotremastrum suecicum HHB10207 ss-3]
MSKNKDRKRKRAENDQGTEHGRPSKKSKQEPQSGDATTSPEPQAMNPASDPQTLKRVRKKLASLGKLESFPCIRDESLLATIMRCHPTSNKAVTLDQLLDPVIAHYTASKSTLTEATNKCAEGTGDRFGNCVIEWMVKPYCLTRRQHVHVTSMLSCNAVLGQVFCQMGLLYHPLLQLSQSDACQVNEWAPADTLDEHGIPANLEKDDPPKALANVMESAFTAIIKQEKGDFEKFCNWIAPILEALIDVATTPGDETCEDLESPYKLKPYSNHCCAMEMHNKLDRVRGSLMDNGSILRDTLQIMSDGELMEFDTRGVLKRCHSDLVEDGERYLETSCAAMFALKQPENIFTIREGEDFAFYLAEVESLVMSPQVSGYIGLWLGLHDFFANQEDRDVPRNFKLRQALFAAVGWYAHFPWKDVSVTAKFQNFVEIIVAAALDTLGPDQHGFLTSIAH